MFHFYRTTNVLKSTSIDGEYEDGLRIDTLIILTRVTSTQLTARLLQNHVGNIVSPLKITYEKGQTFTHIFLTLSFSKRNSISEMTIAVSCVGMHGSIYSFSVGSRVYYWLVVTILLRSLVLVVYPYLMMMDMTSSPTQRTKRKRSK